MVTLNSWFGAWFEAKRKRKKETSSGWLTCLRLHFLESFNSGSCLLSSQPFPHFLLVHLVLGYSSHLSAMRGPKWTRGTLVEEALRVWAGCPCMPDEIPAASKWKPVPRSAAIQQQCACDWTLMQGNPNDEHRCREGRMCTQHQFRGDMCA